MLDRPDATRINPVAQAPVANSDPDQAELMRRHLPAVFMLPERTPDDLSALIARIVRRFAATA